MNKLLIAGVDTIVGANLAAWLAPRYQVLGLSWGEVLTIAGCETAACDEHSTEAPRQWIASERPQWVVYCGPGARSTWSLPAAPLPHHETVGVAGAWAKAAQEFGCELTVISSDAVFTGPWMFHRENGACYCESNPARVLRMIEKEVTEVYAKTLLVRTNVYGWSPEPAAPGLVETVLQAVEEGRPIALDCMRHGTPILATDFAETLDLAYQKKLQGTYHLSGGERINPFRFACLLADQFGHSLASLEPIETPFDNRREFGAGETSLQNRRLRKALEVAVPLVRDGLARLYEQHASGYRDRFGALQPALAEKVA